MPGRASYELHYDLGRDLLLQQRLSVILDSPAAYPIIVERATALAREADAALRVVLCLAERETAPSQRNADVGLVGDRARDWGHLPANALAVWTNRPVADLLPGVLAQVEGGVRC